MSFRPHQVELERGVDLFNRACFFEAHEVLEDIWRSVGREEPGRRHWQGLVQLAVAFHHQSTGNFLGARSVMERALRNLHGGDETFPDLDLDRLRTDLTPWREFLEEPKVKTIKSRPPKRRTTPRLPKIIARESDR
jgi:predicted metal-dependent hydrolase